MKNISNVTAATKNRISALKLVQQQELKHMKKGSILHHDETDRDLTGLHI